ncbi:MAG TPA: hypothetical protein VFI43_09475, partial [Nitrosospira sp.]|nr:hypothetical protein [Nitrosospira sp.]
DDQLAVAVAQACVTAGYCGVVRHIIEQSLDRQWNPELARLYGECPEKDAIGQIERAEGWLASHPGDAGLLLALGKLCIQQELWGKAQNYLDASLSIDRDYPAHLALAQLNEKIGQARLAKDHYDRGLALALHRLKVLGHKHLVDENGSGDDLRSSGLGTHVLDS